MNVGGTVQVRRRRSPDAILAAIKREVPKRNLQLAKAAEPIAVQLCPKSNHSEPGYTHLWETIRVEQDERTGNAFLIMGDESKGVTHGAAVELGTANRAAQPTLIPASEMAARQSRNLGIRLNL